eukprot:scaffold25062_cov61-Phaeocystis_antarctica.AAC.1
MVVAARLRQSSHPSHLSEGYAPHSSSERTTWGLRHLGELQWASCTRGRGSPKGDPPGLIPMRRMWRGRVDRDCRTTRPACVSR